MIVSSAAGPFYQAFELATLSRFSGSLWLGPPFAGRRQQLAEAATQQAFS